MNVYIFTVFMILMMVESSISINFHNKLDTDSKAEGGVSFGYSFSVVVLLCSLGGLGYAGWEIYNNLK